MIGPILLLYAATGIFSAVVAIMVFPPAPGFRPRFRLQLASLVVLVGCWPALWLLALWYAYRVFLAWLYESSASDEFSVTPQFHVAKPK